MLDHWDVLRNDFELRGQSNNTIQIKIITILDSYYILMRDLVGDILAGIDRVMDI